MTKFLASALLLAFVAVTPGDRLRSYTPVDAFEVRPGIVATPSFQTSHELCAISIEKRHYYRNSHVDLDATMTKALIVSLFDELVPDSERGGQDGRLPVGTEMSESDTGMLSTRIPYKNVTLWMYGKSERWAEQHYVVAVIVWNKPACEEN